MSGWVYIFGERNGADLKVGYTGASTVAERLRGVNREQTTDESYVCLAAVAASRKDEAKVKRAFGEFMRPKGTKREYVWPVDEAIEYAAWLRSQWFSSPDGEDKRAEWICVEPEVWLPDGPARRMPRPQDNPEKIVQDWDALGGALAGTAWSWFPNPKASIQDYFTPTEIVDAVREGMGGIDLDAASHWLANKRHRIPRYFHIGYSAFEHDWEGRVWLNPPYGDNEPWWTRAMEFIDSGQVEQLSIISPVWSFTTQLARPLMARTSAMLLLSPTPKFWGNSEGRTGKNHPHAIVYIGHRKAEVMKALSPFGIPFHLALDQIADFRPREDE